MMTSSTTSFELLQIRLKTKVSECSQVSKGRKIGKRLSEAATAKGKMAFKKHFKMMMLKYFRGKYI